MNINNELESVEKAYEESKYVNDKIRLIITKLEALKFLKEVNSLDEKNAEKQVECIRDDLVTIKTKLDSIIEVLNLEDL